MGLPDPSFNSLMQNVERQTFHSADYAAIPTLIKNSYIYRISKDTSLDRPASPMEFFAFQCLP
eukprot:8983207-Pyramimonas_sp.AAC.1